ncbi:MAG: metal ABC transporter ATP-binding protein [Alphaproteobacteria bacterium]|nr:metal ABC transporter ATP-binding protein [Alphaproteobacteria bacterium]
MAEPLVRLDAVRVDFGGQPALEDVTLAVMPGQVVTIVGPNGAGKSTLLRVVLGLLRPHGGTVWRRPGLTVGYVPQSFQVAPGLPMTVRRFLTLAARGLDEARLIRALDEVGLPPSLLDRQLGSLSGGQRRRALVARAALRSPDLLVLDEPVGGVDVVGQAELYDRIGVIRAETGCGVLMVSHDLHLVMAATDHVVCLNRHVCCQGPPHAVGRDPSYVRLFGAQAAAALAIYAHRHDHRHDAAGHAEPLDGGECRHDR